MKHSALMLGLTLAVGITVGAIGTRVLNAQQPPASRPFVATVLQQEPLGELPPGKWNMKAAMLVIEPGGEIPFHVHKGPGLRYVLEGAITINWKDGKTQTFEAGSTYFEGPGENHPSGNISARNNGTVPCRVVIVELVPQG
ncbi:MAG: cupin domain-containing protein [candidate division NC10 bacterium]|nr:cupin domain-containing protein [candidate division NC10 bacterium]